VADAEHNMARSERKTAEAVKKYGGPHYFQQNPQAADGFEAFGEWVEASWSSSRGAPRDQARCRRGRHGRDAQPAEDLPRSRGTAVVDLYRLEDGKVVEHWDVMQPIPESSANGHPMF
jgi:predicted SnoaL-like aldol condensation-catalyzing enzyme